MKRLQCLSTVALSAVVILGASGCEQTGQSRSLPFERSDPAVYVTQVEHNSAAARWTSTGTLDATRSVTIFNEVDGRLISFPHYPGDRVEEGEVLARLDDALIQAELDKAAAQRRQEQLVVNRLERLTAQRLVSEDELDRARTAVQVMIAEELLHRTRLSHTVIHAPFSGVVKERLREPGDVVPRHSHLLTLIDPAALTVSLRVSELQLPQVMRGDRVEVTIDALGRQAFEGRVVRVYPGVDPLTRQGVIEVGLDPAPGGALPGQFTRVTFTTPEVERLVVPQSAVQYDRQGAFVYQVNADDSVRMSRILTGQRFGDRVEVLDGLDVDARVVVRGFLELREGRTVRVVERENLIRANGLPIL